MISGKIKLQYGKKSILIFSVVKGKNMLNAIWLCMIVISVICSIMTDRVGELSNSVGGGAEKAVQLVISMAGVLCLWSGIMKIAERSGLTELIARLLSPVLGRLMPDHRKNKRVMEAVSANVTANILGLGNAATPLGIAAMKEMKRSALKDEPDDSMIMFVLINTASIQIIPATTAALRQAAGSVEPYSILPFVWMASGIALCTGIVMAKLLAGLEKKRRAR